MLKAIHVYNLSLIVQFNVGGLGNMSDRNMITLGVVIFCYQVYQI